MTSKSKDDDHRQLSLGRARSSRTLSWDLWMLFKRFILGPWSLLPFLKGE